MGTRRGIGRDRGVEWNDVYDDVFQIVFKFFNGCKPGVSLIPGRLNNPASEVKSGEDKNFTRLEALKASHP